MEALAVYEDDLTEQRLRDKAQAVAGREYRQLRAQMLTGQDEEIRLAAMRLREELPPDLANDVSFQRLLNALQREVLRVAEQDIVAVCA
jgi:hypothetical protein